MDRIEKCQHCGAEISMKYNNYPGSCTETEHYDCPNCGKHLFSSRDSGYYSDLKVISNVKNSKQKEVIE